MRWLMVQAAWAARRSRRADAAGLRGAFRESMQHEPDEEVSWCDDVARA